MAGEMGKLKPLNICVHIHYSALFPTCWFVMIMTSLKSVALTNFLLQTLVCNKNSSYSVIIGGTNYSPSQSKVRNFDFHLRID